MNWRVAESLDILLAQINRAFPGRDKSSDGSIGDLRHQHERSSDHNPYIIDRGVGVVTARDFTNDPTHGAISEKIAEALRASQDPRIKYIISNKKICSGTDQGRPAWQWRTYTGSNPHNHHVHVSVKSAIKLYDDTSPWHLDLPVAMVPPPGSAASATKLSRVLRKGSKDEPPADDVRRLQAVLSTLGAQLRADGNFGEKTEDAVRDFQRKSGLTVDGVVGAYTWDALNAAAPAPKTANATTAPTKGVS